MEYIQFLVKSFSNLNPKILRVLRVFRAVRAVRALRVLRTISFVKKLQTIASTLLSSIPAMGSIILLLFLMSCECLCCTCFLSSDLTFDAFADVFAIMGVRMFQAMLPSHFGSIYRASFTLYQLITLDDWYQLYDAIRVPERGDNGSDSGGVHPSFLYFLIYIVIENFVFVNLFTAVIVNNLEVNRRTGEYGINFAKRLGTDEQINARQLHMTDTPCNGSSSQFRGLRGYSPRHQLNGIFSGLESCTEQQVVIRVAIYSLLGGVLL
jgi:hypothetical protein